MEASNKVKTKKPETTTRKRRKTKSKPADFNLRVGVESSKPRTYNALKDKNLTAFFSQRSVQKRIVETGLVTRDGRLVDQTKQRGRLLVIEQEMRAAALKREREEAEKLELERQKAILEARRKEMHKKARMIAELKQAKLKREGAMKARVGLAVTAPVDLPPAPFDTAYYDELSFGDDGRASVMSLGTVSQFSEDLELARAEGRELDVQLRALDGDFEKLLGAYDEVGHGHDAWGEAQQADGEGH